MLNRIFPFLLLVISTAAVAGNVKQILLWVAKVMDDISESKTGTHCAETSFLSMKLRTDRCLKKLFVPSRFAIGYHGGKMMSLLYPRSNNFLDRRKSH
ncbi:unnamed protein product [Allacma fusca]|uniref:Secreted protein n=1 Tax=Allacma fusca TaxID=39272 RepID=A0A8J2LHG8_9HEXA|nr:unnamed protein product [Allacma fusca]